MYFHALCVILLLHIITHGTVTAKAFMLKNAIDWAPQEAYESAAAYFGVFPTFMYFHALCVILLLNIITHGTVTAKECSDRGEASLCAAHEEKGDCKRPEHEEQMKLICKKTCEFCA
ncbi:shTK domain protein [Ostertagia ostertagi]